MKKLFALLLALMMVFALAACGEQGDGGKSNKDGKKPMLKISQKMCLMRLRS